MKLMAMFFDRKKSLIALVLAVLFIMVAARWIPFSGVSQKSSVNQRPALVAGGPPNETKSFAEFMNSLPENKRECAKKAYGRFYTKLLENPTFLLPKEEEWRVNEFNKCLQGL